MKIDPSRAKRVLVLGLSCVGDMMLATAALWNLRRFLPTAHFTILAPPSARQVLEEDPLWDVVGEYKREKGLWGRIASVKMVRSIPHDLLIDLRSSAMPLFCGARYAPLWGLREMFLPKTMHEAERNIWCMQTLGVPIYSRGLRFFVPPAVRESVRAELASRGNASHWIFFNPGSKTLSKNWPPGHFTSLAKKMLDDTGGNIGIIGYTSYEREIAAQICGDVASRRCVDFSGPYPITRLGALLERAVLFVSNDSGPLHIASAVGTPTVGLYRARNLPRFGPWGTRHRSLAAADDGDESMRNIAVEDVRIACLELLNSSGVFPPSAPFGEGVKEQ